MNFDKFKEYNKKKLFKIIIDGSIVVVKNAVKKKQIVKICEKINKKKMVQSKSTKMIEGIKNIYYKASPSKLAYKNYEFLKGQLRGQRARVAERKMRIFVLLFLSHFRSFQN